MRRILAIDPGPTESAYVVIDADTRRPIEVGKVPNGALLDDLMDLTHPVQTQAIAIEMVASYGMAVGKEVFETCVWIGRFQQHLIWRLSDSPLAVRPTLIYRREVKAHHCHDSRAKDANITQALIDRFASGEPNRGKGTKANPGWFHGFKADIWQAYALAVLMADESEQVPF